MLLHILGFMVRRDIEHRDLERQGISRLQTDRRAEIVSYSTLVSQKFSLLSSTRNATRLDGHLISMRDNEARYIAQIFFLRKKINCYVRSLRAEPYYVAD